MAISSIMGRKRAVEKNKKKQRLQSATRKAEALKASEEAMVQSNVATPPPPGFALQPSSESPSRRRPNTLKTPKTAEHVAIEQDFERHVKLTHTRLDNDWDADRNASALPSFDHTNVLTLSHHINSFLTNRVTHYILQDGAKDGSGDGKPYRETVLLWAQLLIEVTFADAKEAWEAKLLLRPDSTASPIDALHCLQSYMASLMQASCPACVAISISSTPTLPCPLARKSDTPLPFNPRSSFLEMQCGQW